MTKTLKKQTKLKMLWIQCYFVIIIKESLISFTNKHDEQTKKTSENRDREEIGDNQLQQLCKVLRQFFMPFKSLWNAQLDDEDFWITIRGGMGHNIASPNMAIISYFDI